MSSQVRVAWSELRESNSMSNPSSLRSLLDAERASGIHAGANALADPSAAIALLWMRRSLTFQVGSAFFRRPPMRPSGAVVGRSCRSFAKTSPMRAALELTLTFTLTFTLYLALTLTLSLSIALTLTPHPSPRTRSLRAWRKTVSRRRVRSRASRTRSTSRRTTTFGSRTPSAQRSLRCPHAKTF